MTIRRLKSLIIKIQTYMKLERQDLYTSAMYSLQTVYCLLVTILSFVVLIYSEDGIFLGFNQVQKMVLPCD
jgi:hypothetical protein